MRTKPLDFQFDDYNFLAIRSSGGLVPPSGYSFVINPDGSYVINPDGSYLIQAN